MAEPTTTPPTPIDQSVRQGFAASALNALIQKPQPLIGSGPVEDTIVLAKKAWAYADAMMKTEAPATTPPAPAT